MSLSHNKGIEPTLDLLFQKEQQVPGSIRYKLSRFFAHHDWVSEDLGMLVYHYNVNEVSENHIEIRFCVSGNKACFEQNCSGCSKKPTDCSSNQPTIDVVSFFFSSSFLQQFTQQVKTDNKKEEVVSFKYTEGFKKTFPLCNKQRNLLDALLTHNYKGALENIFINAKAHDLLLVSLDCLVADERPEGFTCKFLNDERGREAIEKVKEILLQKIGSQITIKEISRMVAMNECYVKRGFKELYGTTVFDFYQQQKMEHAKYLMYEKGLSVKDVSDVLGYSSVSHFSTAYKKHTGMRPCELIK